MKLVDSIQQSMLIATLPGVMLLSLSPAFEQLATGLENLAARATALQDAQRVRRSHKVGDMCTSGIPQNIEKTHNAPAGIRIPRCRRNKLTNCNTSKIQLCITEYNRRFRGTFWYDIHN
jgi:hypothetical protein